MATLEEYGYQPARLSPSACLSMAWETVRPQYWLFLGIHLVSSLIYGTVFLLIGPLLVGIFHCLDRVRREQRVEFSHAFSGFNSPQVGPLILYSLIYAVILGAISIAGYLVFLFGFIGMGVAADSAGGEAEAAAMMFTGMFGGFCCYGGAVAFGSFISVYWLTFASMLAFDRNAPMGDAMTLGFVLLAKNFWPLLGLGVITGLLSLLGMLACFVGVIFVAPLVLAAPWAAYRTWFPDHADPDTFGPPSPT